MKLSLAWIFDHIESNPEGNWRTLDVTDLIQKLSAKTAEIEDVRQVTLDVHSLTLVRVVAQNTESITVESPELKRTFVLPQRPQVSIDELYLAKKQGKKYQWATLADLSSQKEGLVPAVSCASELIKGSWKETLELTDYIIELDNKTITNRPDLWGHRGFAREIAALLGMQLISEEHFLAAKPIKHYTRSAPVSSTSPFTLEITPEPGECGRACRRLAGLYIPEITAGPSALFMAHRLARIDARPINMLVDTTNYVMFDIGQPMHAFDAGVITTHKIIGRCAHEGEKLQLLDGETLQLTVHDYVITDGSKPLALAGIMGGLESAVTPHTKELFIESGNFDAGIIRKTATRIKKRTEASTRFEKSLDPNNNTQALLRFLKLLSDYKIAYRAADAIASVGPLAQETLLELSHEFIVQCLGTSVKPEKVEHILTKLGFGVQVTSSGTQILYTVTVSTYRNTKDITLPVDLVEEIARFVGYDTIPLQLPERTMAPFTILPVMRTRALKSHLAHALAMHEIQTYALYDEDFLRKIHYSPADTLRIANPLSENWQRLVTSLVPNILKALAVNCHRQDTLNFFELNRVWFMEFADAQPIERKEVAGIFFERTSPLDFYTGQARLTTLFKALSVDVTWETLTSVLTPWYNAYQVAQISHKGQIIGRAGKIATSMLSYICDSGDAFIFELDAGFLVQYAPQTPCFRQLAKYPEVRLDISMFVPYTLTAAHIKQIIQHTDARIKQVQLIDLYEKPQWDAHKSLTFALSIVDENKTLTKEEIDALWNTVVTAVTAHGATVR